MFNFGHMPSIIDSWISLYFQTVIDILKKQSEPGDIHENTFLIVMGDHGQTTNGDHGGGTAEEVYCFLSVPFSQSQSLTLTLTLLYL